MCDTAVAFDKKRELSFFGKNSDRDPGEPQIIYLSSDPGKELRQRPYEIVDVRN